MELIELQIAQKAAPQFILRQ